jgi:DNA polymerase-3 subunit epsilon/exodeoxyribonuclease X
MTDGTVVMPNTSWTAANLVALDLEGSGAQDRDHEAILEIAVVPMSDGGPAVADAYATLINPGRPVPRRPWISPGLTNEALADAPVLAAVELTLAEHLNGYLVVGHNIGVDWRLLHRLCPSIQPAGLIDTLGIARRLWPGRRSGSSLTALLGHFSLTGQVDSLVPGGQPHRALWDATATAILLGSLVQARWNHPPTTAELVATAGVSFVETKAGEPAPDTLF